MEYYVYLLSYPEQMGGAVFYVGKGSGERVHQHEKYALHGYSTCNVKKLTVISRIQEAGYEVVKTIVFTTRDEQEALKRERELIALHSAIITNIQYNTHVNPIPRWPSVALPVLTREERLKQAIERALWLNRQAASRLRGAEREDFLQKWDHQSIQRLTRTVV